MAGFEIFNFSENAAVSENYGPEHDSEFYTVTPATPELLQLLFKGCVGAFFSY
jgi:hypothetical protein